MPTYKTPDVYVEEISVFPPSVAEVATAIPAFIGYTEKADKSGSDLTLKPTKIESLVDYEELFGGGPPITPTVKLDEKNNVTEVDLGSKTFYMYDSLRLYFNNGGGRCYVVSVGDYYDTPALGDDSSGIQGGLKALEKEDEPTILLSPDAVLLSSTELYSFQQSALSQCNKLQDRFLVCDLKNSGDLDTDVQDFRDNIGINYLKYGAAYVPWLQANFKKQVYFRDITLKRASSDAELSLVNLTKDSDIKSFIQSELQAAIDAVDEINDTVISDNLTGSNSTLKEQFDSLKDSYDSNAPYTDADDFQTALRNIYSFLKDVVYAMAVDVYDSITPTTTFKLKTDLATIFKNNDLDSEFQKLIYHHNAPAGFSSGGIFDTTDTTIADTINAVNTITGSTIDDDLSEASNSSSSINAEYTAASSTDDKGTLALEAAVEVFASVNTAVSELLETAESYETTFDGSLADMFSTYKNILTEINESLNELPPCGAVAGVYASTDRDRGVWKAPANVSISSVIGPNTKIDSKAQEDLNVDTNAGKSVNAIRAFTGKGTLIWGARTLAGNDNEWRYIPVRRFFNMVEESVKKSTYFAVFEPNNANTWMKVKSMIENYLTLKWKDGALAGAKPDEAFFVKVGLGTTMTAQDILEGRMNVEIGMAVVRPAEFIILKFSHKLQES